MVDPTSRGVGARGRRVAGPLVASHYRTDSVGWAVLFSVAVGVSSGCSDSEPPGRHTQSGPTIDSEPAWSIGGQEGDLPHEFGRISDAVLLSDGRVVVLDGLTSEVFVYSSDGRVDVWGRRGAGPGEFQAPERVVADGSRVRVWDAAAWRESSFSLEGTLLSVRTIDPVALSESLLTPPLWAAEVTPVAGGRYKLVAREKSKEVERGERSRPTEVVLLLDEELKVTAESGELAGREHAAVSAPWGTTTLPLPFGAATLTAASAAGELCTSDQASVELTCYLDSGAVESHWEMARPRVNHQAAEYLLWVDSIEGLYGSKVNSADLDRMISSVELPVRRPAYSSLHIDPTGARWLRRSAEPVFDLVSRDGVRLGAVSSPPGRTVDLGEEYALFVSQDALGVDRLSVYSIVR